MKKRFFIGFVLLFVLLSALGLLLCSGRLWFNSPSLTEYPVRGIDVSHYQGTIDWQQIARQDIRFAFIKATEGSSYQDSLFSENWSAAMQTDIRIGAYHFFSYDSPGLFQAKNFIQTVPKTDHMLPPVIDLEFYGKYRSEPLPKADVCAILDSLLAALEQHYQMKPILYVTPDIYEMYIRGGYCAYPIWLRSVYEKAALPDNREWTFWQYSHRGSLKGYDGPETYIDLNVFNGTEEEFAHFPS